MFSSRLPDLTPNKLTAILAERRAAGLPIIDLTLSNPTRAGIAYPMDLLTPLTHERGLVYQPEALGLLEARAAVARDYARRGVIVSVDRIALTASTSEAYSLLFKVLCDPGDEVLVPRPSYPLFEHLTRLDGLIAAPYDLEYHGRWSVDLDSLEHATTTRTRAIIGVSPNNPTGSYLKTDELLAIGQICERSQLALIVDEVFADYPLSPGGHHTGDPLSARRGLTFSLGGLSKSIGLPQAKLGWIAAAGDGRTVADAMSRVEFACDTYLSVSTPLQAAAAELLAGGGPVRAAIHERVQANYESLRSTVAAVPSCRLLEAEGGWYGIVRVPTLTSEEDLVVSLLETSGVLVHPGYFFDFASGSHLIVSLLPRPEDFKEGIRAMLRHFDCTA